MEFGIGGAAAVCAGFFTNPLEVMKIRMQLQGELQKKGAHAVHYKNVLHAGYVIAKHDGILALQKGLSSALGFQFVLNSIRFGSYQTISDMGLLNDKNGQLIFYRSMLAGGATGAISGYIASPLYLIKTHFQAASNSEIAVGHQHKHSGTLSAFVNIFKVHGIKGLFRGSLSAIPRLFVGSMTQLSSFAYTKEWMKSRDIFTDYTILSSFTSAMIGGVAVAFAISPFDLISTRLYNQGVDKNGKGILYKNYMDCVFKILKTEGVFGFYKGIGAAYFRIGPHTVLSLVFWDEFRKLYNNATSIKETV